MRLPKAFFVLMLPLALSAFTLPSTLARVIEAAPGNGDFHIAAVDVASSVTAANVSGEESLVRVRADHFGHFNVFGVVNGRRVSFLVDTGATQVAIRQDLAQELGLIRPGDEATVNVKTANGPARAIPITLSRIDIDGVSVANVSALVLPDSALTGNLLGMSFISKLKRFEMADGSLTLVR